MIAETWKPESRWAEFRTSPVQFVKGNPEWVLAPLLFVVLISLWYFATSMFTIPEFVLPPPGKVWFSLVNGLSKPLSNPGGYWFHALYTATEAVIGFFIGSAFGIVLGVLVAHSRLVERTVYPYIIAFQSLPKVAIAPLFVIWFGFGLEPKVLVVCVVSFFPLVVNTIAGCRSVDVERLEMARALGATKWQTFTKITFPSSLPYVFAGLHMAAVLSVIGAIVGEFVGAQRGLGVLILQYNYQMDIASVYAVFVVLAAMGIVFNVGMRAMERKFCCWAQRGNDAIGM